jgi:hypothetical protein
LPVVGAAVGLLVVGGLVLVLVQSRRREPRPVYCPHCGAENAPGHRFCLKCGTPLSGGQ